MYKRRKKHSILHAIGLFRDEGGL